MSVESGRHFLFKSGNIQSPVVVAIFLYSPFLFKIVFLIFFFLFNPIRKETITFFSKTTGELLNVQPVTSVEVHGK